MMISPPTRRAFLMGAAALSLPLPVRAQAYQPGGTLSVVKFDRPGDASVNSYILIGPRTQVILDCQRTAVEARQLVAMARGLDLPVEAIVLSHEHPDHVAALRLSEMPSRTQLCLQAKRRMLPSVAMAPR